MSVINRLNPRAGRAPADTSAPTVDADRIGELRRRRDQLSSRMAELQWDLGGLVYEMAIRDSIRTDVIVTRAAALQNVDAELSEVERILRLEETGAAGDCQNCGAPHSSGAVYCWQCGAPLLELVPASVQDADEPAPEAAAY